MIESGNLFAGSPDTLVSRFRSSHTLVVTSDANFGIKGTLASIMKLVWFWFRNSLGGLAARVEGISEPPH